MTYNEYCILEYIGYRKKKAANLLSEKEMRGWLDYYHRIDLKQAEINAAIHSLIGQGLIVQKENAYQASEELRKLRKASHYWLGDILVGLKGCTRSRFKESLEKKYGISMSW